MLEKIFALGEWIYENRKGFAAGAAFGLFVGLVMATAFAPEAAPVLNGGG